MNFPIYVREFAKSEWVQSDCKTHPRSQYFPFPMKNALYRLQNVIKPTDYILCPIYDDYTFQIGVTGTVEENEQFQNAMLRELGEEIGLVPNEMRYVKAYEWRRFGKPDTQFVVYEANINECEPVCENEHGADLSENNDRTDKKVGCFVYGSKDSILEFLNKEDIYCYHSGDHIIGIAGVCMRFITTDSTR